MRHRCLKEAIFKLRNQLNSADIVIASAFIRPESVRIRSENIEQRDALLFVLKISGVADFWQVILKIKSDAMWRLRHDYTWPFKYMWQNFKWCDVATAPWLYLAFYMWQNFKWCDVATAPWLYLAFYMWQNFLHHESSFQGNTQKRIKKRSKKIIKK